jgi:hypothetical protein
MQKTTTTCDCCFQPVEDGPERDLIGSLVSLDNPEDVIEIEFDDLCVGCSDALLVAIKEVLLRRQKL